MVVPALNQSIPLSRVASSSSSSTKTHRSGGSTAVSSLPNELLALIFDFAFRSACQFAPSSSADSSNATSSQDATLPIFVMIPPLGFASFPPPEPVDNVFYHQWPDTKATLTYANSQNLFPMSCAQVCTGWRSILSAFPHFWTRIVVQLGDVATLREYLAWSKSLYVSIAVVRRTASKKGRRVLGGSKEEGEEGEEEKESQDFAEYERWQVEKAMEVIMPHMWRCVSLRLGVKRSSALPCVKDLILRGHRISVMRELKLACKVYDGKNWKLDVNKWEIPVDYDSGQWGLQHLQLDGGNLQALSDLAERPSYRSLSVAHFSTIQRKHGRGIDDDVHPLLLDNILPFLSRSNSISLTSLTLSFVPSPTFIHPRAGSRLARTSLAASEITLDHLSAELIHEFLLRTTRYMLTTFTLSRCTTFHIPIHLSTCPHIILKDIDAAYDLTESLFSWKGHSLTLSRCPSFNDRVLAMMAGKKTFSATVPQQRGSESGARPATKSMGNVALWNDINSFFEHRQRINKSSGHGGGGGEGSTSTIAFPAPAGESSSSSGGGGDNNNNPADPLIDSDNHFDDNATSIGCVGLENLTIHACAGFSTHALIGMVNARNGTSSSGGGGSGGLKPQNGFHTAVPTLISFGRVSEIEELRVSGAKWRLEGDERKTLKRALKAGFSWKCKAGV